MPNYNGYSNTGYYPMQPQYGQASMMPNNQVLPNNQMMPNTSMQTTQQGSMPMNAQQRFQSAQGRSNMRWVHGVSGAYSAIQDPGTIDMYMDDTEQYFYVKETDPYTGRPKLSAYKYMLVDLPSEGASGTSTNSVSREEFDNMSRRIDQMQSMMQNFQQNSGYGSNQGQNHNQNQGGPNQ